MVGKAARAFVRAGAVIRQHLMMLGTIPEIGRPYPDLPEMRELVTSFGDSGYVALYRYAPGEDTVYVMTFRHQKGNGYWTPPASFT